jgi:hypothetical protein
MAVAPRAAHPRARDAVDFAESGAERARGMGAAIEEGQVRLRRSDFAPRRTSAELIAEKGAARVARGSRATAASARRRAVPNEADERLWYLLLRLPADGGDLRGGTEDRRDISAATDRAHLELGLMWSRAHRAPR